MTMWITSYAESKSSLLLPAGALEASLVHVGDVDFPTILKEPSTSKACVTYPLVNTSQ